MLNGEDLVYMCEGKWSFERGGHMSGFFPKLAADNRLLYIDMPVAAQYFYKYPKKGIPRIIESLAPPKQIRDNFYTWSPFPYVPYGNRDINKERLNRHLLGPRISKTIKKLGFKSPILIVQRYNSAPWLGAFGEKLSCYLCVDEYAFTTSSEVKDPVIMDIEVELVKNVDIVMCTASLLVEDKKKHNDNCHLLANAADLEHFLKVDSDETRVAPELESLEGPILGLIATTPGRIDIDLLRAVATKRRDLHIVMVGYLDSPEIWSLADEPNVSYLGWRDFKDIPGYIKGFDVCLIPFKVNPQMDTMNPYKLHEYVAAGKPLVSTGLAEVKAYAQKYPGTVYWGSTADEFIDAIDKALTEEKQEARALRLAAAKANTWDIRLEKFTRIVREQL